MGFGTFYIIATILLVAIVISAVIISSNKKKIMEDHLSHLKDFSVSQKVFSADATTGLAIDEQRNMFCLINHRTKTPSFRVYSYKDLLSCEIFEDGSTITTTVRSSQVGGALLGGILLGGVGAIIGGLSGKTKSSDKVKKVDLRLTVNDTKSPLHDITLLNLETKKGGFLHNTAMQNARHWHGLIEVLIRRADAEDKANTSNSQSLIQSASMAYEIKKLADLRNSGILSENEFQQQKKKLLKA